MENWAFTLWSKCSIFHNIFKYMIFQRSQKALLWHKGLRTVPYRWKNLILKLGDFIWIFFFWLSVGIVTSTESGGFLICVFILWWEHPKAQLKVVLEKLGMKPATPGLQGYALIHYTTAASDLIWKCVWASYNSLYGSLISYWNLM